MKRLRPIATVLPALLLAFIMISCGQTYHLQSIVLAPPSTSIEGISNYASFKVMAQLSNGQTEDVTTKATFSIAAPADISTGGQNYMLSQIRLTQGSANQVQGTGGVCTWSWQQTLDSAGKSTYQYATDPFTITATFEGQTAKGTVSVNTVSGCYDPSRPAPDGTLSGSGLPY